jgi:MATE family multidrug resistance protein
MRFDWDLMMRFLKYGFPSGMQWALEGLAFTAFLIYVGRMPNGDAALAASGITVTIMMLSVLPAFGVAQAVAVLVGKHLGENKPELAERASWSGLQIAAIYIISVGLSFVAFPNFYLSWFHNAENQTLWNEISVIVPPLLLFVSLFTAFDSINLVFSFALKGAGDTRFVSLVALVLPWPLMVIPTWLVSQKENGIYWAWGAASVFIMTQACIFWMRFVRGKWKSMRVIEA